MGSYKALANLVGKNFSVLDDGQAVYLTPAGEIRNTDGEILMPASEGRAQLFNRNEEYIGKVIGDLSKEIEELKGKDPGGGISKETDPTVPDWAKQPEKPTYTAAQVGADPAGTAADAVGDHNVDDDAHNDIRIILQEISERLNAVLDSDDATLDELSEIVAYIKSNKSLIDAVTTSKVNVSDIINNLTTNVANKPLSAAQGVALKALIDAIKVPTKLSELAEDASHRVVSDAEKAVWNAKSDFSGSYTDLTSKPNIPTVPTKVSAFQNDAGYLTQHQDISGKLDAYKLPEAVNNALAQAKASGEFDGENGDNGTSVTVKSVSESSADGGSNVVTFSDGKTLTVKNGSKGTDATVTTERIINALGYTPADVNVVFEAATQPKFTNIFDTVEIQYGKSLNSAGAVEDTGAAMAVTDYIPIVKNQTVRVKDFALYTRGDTPCIVLYGADYSVKTYVNMKNIDTMTYYIGNVVKDTNGDVVEFSVLNPGSLAYIRICNHTSNIGKIPVLTIDEPIEYEMGYGTKMNPAVRMDYSQIVNAPQKNGWSILPYERLNIAYSSIGRKPINTVEHFTDAAENYGYNALKCDVRPTSDGELVCCHDAGFTFDSNGYITTYNSSNQTKIHDVTAETCLSYSHRTGEHPCLVGDYLAVCRKYGKVAFVTIRNEYMDVVIPKLLEELRIHNMTHSTIINCMTYESLVQWRQQDQTVMINYTLNAGVAIDQMQIDRAVGLGYCSLCGFGLNSSQMEPNHTCDFEYARENGIRLLQAIASKEGSPEACYALGYDGCQIAYAWGSPAGGVSETDVQTMINNSIGAAIGGAY